MLVLLAGQALASSYYFLDSGTRAIGRGGAFVAGADDMSAQYYNPAALTNIDRPMINLNGWMVNQYVRFDRLDEVDDDGVAVPFEAVENGAAPMLEPSGGFATPLGGIHPALKNTTVALGLYVPTSPYMGYPEDGPQRYGLISSLVWQVYAGPSIAQRITPWLTVGAGLQYTFLRVEQKLSATICMRVEDDKEDCQEGSDDPANDITLDLKTWDKGKMSWNAGVLVQPTPWLDIGASVQPPIHYEGPGTMSATFDEEWAFADQLSDTTFTDQDVTLLVNVPLIVRFGAQVKPMENVRIEAAGTWTQWSKLTELRITDLNMTITPAEDAAFFTEPTVVTDDVAFQTGYQDSWSARLGGDWAPVPWGKVSAGVHWESSAVPSATQGVSVVDGNKFGFGLGGQVVVKKRVGLDVSFAQQYIAKRTISDSEFRQQSLWVNPADTAESEVMTGKVVGNGDFESKLTFFAVGATLFFGAGDATN